jgi:hypothetical protein
MEISKKTFFALAEEVKIAPEKIQAFWERLEKQTSSSPEASPFAKYLYYLGAMIIIAAMTWLMDIAWEIFGGGGIFLISLAYAIGFTILGNSLWKKEGLRIPAGLLITCAVCMTPLAIYGLEFYLHIFPTAENGEHYKDFFIRVESQWIYMELGTILAGIVALYFYPFPFLTAPIFFALWFLSMDIASLLLGKEISWDGRAWISLVFGLLMLFIGFVIDLKRAKDFAFWSYLFGTLAFWCGLNGLVWDKGEGILVLYMLINLLMMVLSIILQRKVLLVFGAIGLYIYLSYLAFKLFAGSILLPFVLSFMGLATIYLGILYQRNQATIESKIKSLFPRVKL